MVKVLSATGVFLAAAALAAPALAAGETIAVVTPYLSAVATKEIVDTFAAEAAGKGWTVEVVDTAGDMGAFAARIEDVTSATPAAIVLVSVDPAQVQDQVDEAKAAGIPVVTLDGAKNAATDLNVTSDNAVLGRTMSEFLVDAIGGKGEVVRFFHSAHPGVRQRELAFDAVLAAHPEVRQVAEHYVQVPGQIENARTAMDAFLLANPGEGAIDAVWAAWDEPGIGANLALEAAGRKGVVIAGIDGNPQAIDLIKGCTAYIGTVRQGFGDMARIAVAELATVFSGGAPSAPELYAPVQLITRESLGVTCG